jgi:hypothetical protein
MPVNGFAREMSGASFLVATMPPVCAKPTAAAARAATKSNGKLKAATSRQS